MMSCCLLFHTRKPPGSLVFFLKSDVEMRNDRVQIVVAVSKIKSSKPKYNFMQDKMSRDNCLSKKENQKIFFFYFFNVSKTIQIQAPNYYYKFDV